MKLEPSWAPARTEVRSAAWPFRRRAWERANDMTVFLAQLEGNENGEAPDQAGCGCPSKASPSLAAPLAIKKSEQR
ncbi:hypothetical protein, partial [Geobacillus sp. WSUCF1]|uniref:hypothetical protein n=1 Tax=Geobacillus sp. WSUCF1 TaxID=886559 RepID=UPI0005194865